MKTQRISDEIKKTESSQDYNDTGLVSRKKENYENKNLKSIKTA